MVEDVMNGATMGLTPTGVTDRYYVLWINDTENPQTPYEIYKTFYYSEEDAMNTAKILSAGKPKKQYQVVKTVAHVYTGRNTGNSCLMM